MDKRGIFPYNLTAAKQSGFPKLVQCRRIRL